MKHYSLPKSKSRNAVIVSISTLYMSLVSCAQSSFAQPTQSASNTATEESRPDSVSSGRQNEPPTTIGGDAVTQIDAPVFVVANAVAQPGLMWRALPRVESIEPIGRNGVDELWRVTHRLGIFTGGYVLRIRTEWTNDGSANVVFMIDRGFDRDVEDGWGTMRIEPIDADHSLLRYHVRAVLAPGVLRWLFSHKIEWSLMIVPQRIKDVIEESRHTMP